MLTQYVSQIEIRIYQPFFLGDIPVYGDSRLHLGKPLLVDMREVVLVDAYGRHAFPPKEEILLDERAEFLVVCAEAERQHPSLDVAFDFFVQLPELLRVVVARGNVPVEVVLVEYVDDVVVGQESDFLGVESADEFRGQVIIERACLSYGQDELYE